MEEIWRDIYFYNKPTEEWIDYRGIYQVSNLGRIKSLDHYVRGYNHGKEFLKLSKGTVLKCRPNHFGYYISLLIQVMTLHCKSIISMKRLMIIDWLI